jgi:hypothetical protein
MHSNVGNRGRAAYHVSHSLSFNTAGHAAGRPGSLNFALVTFREVPDRVVWMTVYPEIVPADVGEFLKVRLVYSRFVQVADKFVRSNGNFWSLGGPRGRGKKQRADQAKDAFVRMGERNETAVSRDSEKVLIVPLFSTAFIFVETW